jgi:hypothetical protein
MFSTCKYKLREQEDNFLFLNKYGLLCKSDHMLSNPAGTTPV